MRSSSGLQSRTSSGRVKIMSNQTADVIAYNGKIATQNEQWSIVEAVVIRDGKFLAVVTDREMMAWRGDQTQLINLNKRTAIPGLNDSHTHLIRGGLNYNLELRWDGVVCRHYSIGDSKSATYFRKCGA
jgi:predicted amidohydrolase YtcJ